MQNADRDASIFELTLRTIIDCRKECPEFKAPIEGLISLNGMLEKAIKAFTDDERYNYVIYVLMLAGLCHKFLYDLGSDHDITTALMESGFFEGRAHANRQSETQSGVSDPNPAGNQNN